MPSGEVVRVEVNLKKIDETSLGNTLTELASELAKLPGLATKAAAIVCDSPEHYAELVSVVDEMQDIGKLGEKKMRPFLDVANTVVEVLHDERKKMEREAKAVYQPHFDRAAKWKREEREAAAREQERINAENARIAREKAEEQRKADEAAAIEKRKARVAEIRGMLKRGEIGKRKAEQLLREAGATEEADKAKAAADAEVTAQNIQPVKVEPNVPKFSGRRGTVHYSAKVMNEELLIGAFANAVKTNNLMDMAYFRQFLMANESKLGEEARKVKDSKKLNARIPGVLFSDEDKV